MQLSPTAWAQRRAWMSPTCTATSQIAVSRAYARRSRVGWCCRPSSGRQWSHLEWLCAIVINTGLTDQLWINVGVEPPYLRFRPRHAYQVSSGQTPQHRLQLTVGKPKIADDCDEQEVVDGVGVAFAS